MRKNNPNALRRSRSWRDLSEAVSKRLFRSDIPRIPLHRTSSLDIINKSERSPITMFQDYEGDYFDTHIPTFEEQRAKERQFQRQASVKRKGLHSGHLRRESTVSTVTTRMTATRPPPQTPKNPTLRHSQLPSFTFSPTELASPVDDLEILPTPGDSTRAPSPSLPSLKSRRNSRRFSTSTAHSHMPSEISLPMMILDFDLALHQDARKFSADGTLKVDLEKPPPTARTLTPEEKADLLSSIPPMHIINIARPEPKRKSPLRRLFSLRKTPDHKRTKSSATLNVRSPPSPPKSSLSSKGSPVRQSPVMLRDSPVQNKSTPNRMGGTPGAKVGLKSTSIYTRPAPPSPPPSPQAKPAIKKDSPPRLTVQIPDSNLERASKIFQSVFLASDEPWVLPSPVSPPDDEVKKESPVAPAPIVPAPVASVKPKLGIWELTPAPFHPPSDVPKESPLEREKSHIFETTPPLVIRRDPPQIPLPTELKRRSRVFIATRGRTPPFPAKMHPHRFSGAVLDIPESDSGSDGDDEDDDVWDRDEVRSRKEWELTLKEPNWEMITPRTRL